MIPDLKQLERCLKRRELIIAMFLAGARHTTNMKYTRAYLAKAGLKTLLPLGQQCLLIHQVAANANLALGFVSIYPAACPGDRLIEIITMR